MRALLAALVVLSAAPSDAIPAEPVERIHPAEGIASIRIEAYRGGSGIHVTFLEDMIPLGGGDGAFPLTLEGPATCRWGWRGPRTASCLFGPDDYLPAAERYALIVPHALTTIGGTAVPPFRMEFETDRPTVLYESIEWASPTSPVIYVQTNVPVLARVLQRQISVQTLDGSGPLIPVQVEQNPAPEQYLPPDQQFVVHPRAALATDTPYVVRVSEGLLGSGSRLVGMAHDAGFFRTHAEAFMFLGIGCGPHADRSRWEYPLRIPLSPDCAPEQPVSLLFSAEPEVRGLYDVLTAAGLPPRIASTLETQRLLYEQTDWTRYQAVKAIYGIRLSGFPAGTMNRVTLPAGIRDRFGRNLEPVTAAFPTRNYVPAFLELPMLEVIASGSGNAVEFLTVNSAAVAARLQSNQSPGRLLLNLQTGEQSVNMPAQAILDVERVLGKNWGVLVGEIGVTPRALAARRLDFPGQYAPSAGAILSPWDVIAAAEDLGLQQLHSVWVSELETGRPVSAATVELLARPPDQYGFDTFLRGAYRAGNVVGTARTNEDGYARIVTDPGLRQDVYYSLVVRVTRGETVVVLPFQAYAFAHRIDEVPRYNADADHPDPGGGYIGEGAAITWGITDKPLYRAGETVRIKGYVRIRDDNRLVIPDRRNDWTLSCMAYANDLCAGMVVDLDRYGAFEVALELPGGVPDGEYRIAAQTDTGGLPSLRFRVANYTPKPHRVWLVAGDDRVIGREPARLEASAEYFAGGALRGADARVIVEVRNDRPPVPQALRDRYWFGPEYQYWNWPRGVQSVTESRFDQRGRLSGAFPLPPGSPASGIATIIVGARHDAAGWTYSDPETVEYVREAYLLGLQQAQESIAAQETYEAGVILVDLRDRNDTDLIVTQSLEYPIDSTDRKPPPPEVADVCTVRVRALEPASCDLVPTRTGYAVVKASLMDGAEEILQTERSLFIHAPAGISRYEPESNKLHLDLSATDFSVADVAELIVDVPYEKASLLFALHRNVIVEQWREILPKGKNRIRIPLAEKHAPGFTLTAIARPVGFAGGTAVGSIATRVRSGKTVPELVVVPDRPGYKAGERARLSLHSTAGSTQVAVAVIDEAVLDLVPKVDALFDPLGPRLAGLLELWAHFQWWQLARGIRDEGSAGPYPGAGAAANQSSAALAMSADILASANPVVDAMSLRRAFAEAAYFNPSLVTSARGVAEVDFAVPDNLGKWRVIAIGADAEGRLFAGTATFDVTLPLEVRAALPARLITGDSIEAGASVLSRKADVTTVTLAIEVETDEGLLGRESGTSSLESMKAFSVSATTGPVSSKEVRLRATVRDGRDVDGVLVSTPVRDTLESRSWTSTAPLSADNPFTQPVELPVNAIDTSAYIRVTLDRSVVGDLSQAFHYASEPGHDTWEQILSRAVVAAYANAWDSGASYRLDKSEMHSRLLQGSRFQTVDGGMSHFEPREELADDYLSAYTLLALERIERLGFEIPGYRQHLYQHVFQRANLGLRGGGYRNSHVPTERDMPVMLAALSSPPFAPDHMKDQYLRYLRSKVKAFDVEELSYALVAAVRLDAPPELQADLSDRLQARLVETFDRIEISGGDYRFASRSELYCVVLDALQQAGTYAPEPRSLAKLVKGGYDFRDQDTGFGNSHANAICIPALTEYARSFEPPADRISARITAPSIERPKLELSAGDISRSSNAVALPLKERRAEIAVSLTDRAAAYVSANVRYDVDLAKEIERSHGYRIDRSYSVYGPEGWRPLEAVGHVTQGDWVRIDLDVSTPVIRRFVAIDDPTPAGLQPVDQSLLPGIPGVAVDATRQWTGFDRQALSDLASRFYAEWLAPGSHRVTYYAQAGFPGDFLALPATVSSMYSEGVFATTAPVRIRVRAAN